MLKNKTLLVSLLVLALLIFFPNNKSANANNLHQTFPTRTPTPDPSSSGGGDTGGDTGEESQPATLTSTKIPTSTPLPIEIIVTEVITATETAIPIETSTNEDEIIITEEDAPLTPIVPTQTPILVETFTKTVVPPTPTETPILTPVPVVIPESTSEAPTESVDVTETPPTVTPEDDSIEQSLTIEPSEISPTESTTGGDDIIIATPTIAASTGEPTNEPVLLVTSNCGQPIIQVYSEVMVYGEPSLDKVTIGTLESFEVRPIIGRYQFADWWLIALANGQIGWIPDSAGQVYGVGSSALITDNVLEGTDTDAALQWQPTPNPECTLTPTPRPENIDASTVPTATILPTPVISEELTESEENTQQDIEEAVQQSDDNVGDTINGDVQTTAPETESEDGFLSSPLLLLGCGVGLILLGLFLFFLRRRDEEDEKEYQA